MAIPSISGAAEQVVPSEPSGVGGSNWHGFAHITWQEPGQTGPGITHYLVYRSINGTDAMLVTELGDSARAYQEMMPSFAINVTYWVVAQNAIGTGNPSTNVTLVPNEFPSAPTGLWATAGSDYVDVSWVSSASNGGDNITGYVVRRQSVQSGESIEIYVPATTTDVPNTSVHDDQASAGSAYFYNVKAVTNVSESAWSDSVTITSPAKDLNDNSGLLSIFALVLAVVAVQMAFVAIYVVIKRKPFKPKSP